MTFYSHLNYYYVFKHNRPVSEAFQNICGNFLQINFCTVILILFKDVLDLTRT